MANSDILLITPPLTQLNTPYPATAYLCGFLKSRGFKISQADLGIDMVLRMFNKNGLFDLFNQIELQDYSLSNGLQNILSNRSAYETTIDAVISFLQNKNYTLAYRIARRNYLPEGPRFNQIDDLQDFFGSISIQDQARYLCSTYLEDLSDLITASIGPQFGFSKYAERIARTAVSFDPIQTALGAPLNFLDDILLQATTEYFKGGSPKLLGLSVPFPGNLYGALKIAQWVKQNHPETKIAMGGGYVNTELRELSDPRIFDYVDFISLDDGEGPIISILEHLNSPDSKPLLKRCFVRLDGEVTYINNDFSPEINHAKSVCPSYEGLKLDRYLSMYDVPNPMHRLWNDGRWNKLTIAHGCYWKKCSFCDISLDYISRYEQAPAESLVDKMEQLIAETGETGFHFVDEAAPPAAMRDLALEILRRNLQVTWWTNIRFEKTFTEDLCKLLAASGCVAVTGGLEVASNRLLELMEKGVTVEQVARVCKGFRDAGILVHAYLMYGFPTETEQETIDSLEVVRQLFQQGLLQSAFWHQFAMTVHSPVGKNPEKYKVIRTGPDFKGFANNDLYHQDPTGADHEIYAPGLNKALYNYMHGRELNTALQSFFDFKIPRTNVDPKLISKSLKKEDFDLKSYYNARVYAGFNAMTEIKRENEESEVLFIYSSGSEKIILPNTVYSALQALLSKLQFNLSTPLSLAEFLSEINKELEMPEEYIIMTGWWKKLRRVIWLVR